jgi:hypothetical protein
MSDSATNLNISAATIATLQNRLDAFYTQN